VKRSALALRCINPHETGTTRSRTLNPPTDTLIDTLFVILVGGVVLIGTLPILWQGPGSHTQICPKTFREARKVHSVRTRAHIRALTRMGQDFTMKSSDSTPICQWVRSRKRMAAHLPTSAVHEKNALHWTLFRRDGHHPQACFSRTQWYSVVSFGFSGGMPAGKPIYRGECIWTPSA